MIEKNFSIVRGTEFRVKLTVTINGNPDLTGYVPEADLRKATDDEQAVASFAFDPSELDETGMFDMVLSPSVTQQVPAGNYKYDVRIVKQAKPIYLLKGSISFITPVTRG